MSTGTGGRTVLVHRPGEPPRSFLKTLHASRVVFTRPPISPPFRGCFGPGTFMGGCWGQHTGVGLPSITRVGSFSALADGALTAWSPPSSAPPRARRSPAPCKQARVNVLLANGSYSDKNIWHRLPPRPFPNGNCTYACHAGPYSQPTPFQSFNTCGRVTPVSRCGVVDHT